MENLRKKQPQGQKSSRCYICGRQGHFTKRCPKNKQGAKMIQMIQQKTGIPIHEEDDVESIFSIDDEPNDNSLFAIQSLEENKDPDSELCSEEIYMFQGQISSSAVVASITPTPHVPVSIYLDKYSKAIDVIAFIDTGDAKTIMNPDILPGKWWKPYKKIFSTASSDVFVTHLISEPITIQFFPGCSVRTRVLGSKLPESHEDFLSKCDHPLWRNSEFYVKLPFKKNEDVNPTKASHTGMNPEHQKLAEAECNELLQQGLIEPSDSQWACEAFYVNKRSEQARGKFKTDEEARLKLLKHFSQLIAQYGVMLSERKMKINQREIEFLGMHLKEGKYHPGSHIAQELLKFPDKDLSKKQILQFLEIIPSDGKRILQTNASDKYWGAILFEEKDKKRHLCGYKSGRFSDAEIHYHSTFKEILAVKKAISKFEFHLIGHHFLVEMDMSSFPQMLKFKQKTVPHPQLLRWAEWFSKFSFDCKHIKGKTNVLADLLTRPKIMMYRASSSKETVPEKKQKKNPETASNIPPNLNPEFPPEVYRLVLENKFHSKARDMIFEYQLDIFRNYGGLMLNPFGLHPDYPFIHPIHFEILEVSDEVKWLLWYFTHMYQVAIQFVLPDLQYFIDEAIQGTEPAITRNLAVMLKWFFPLSHWKEIIDQAAATDQGHFIIIIFYKPQYFMQHGKAKQLGSFPLAHIHSIQWEDVRKSEEKYRALQKHMCQINRQIPKEIWPPPKEQAPWDAWPEDPALLTPYHRAIMEAQKQYKDNIPDPSEWSQDYPWYEISASKINNNDHMETEDGEDNTSTDSAQLPFSNKN
ncbi:hypothetical protein V6N11_056601 [Hibiscus sabdariffa]|uniref:CCHC-type domain-containing protein n=1 Tax=Hibiscus sabdariffa TaxID=183260 RepID=A0ABR2T4U8_9ROSI